MVDIYIKKHNISSVGWQKNMESLLKWKTKVEDEIISMVSSLHRVKVCYKDFVY